MAKSAGLTSCGAFMKVLARSFWSSFCLPSWPWRVEERMSWQWRVPSLASSLLWPSYSPSSFTTWFGWYLMTYFLNWSKKAAAQTSGLLSLAYCGFRACPSCASLTTSTTRSSKWKLTKRGLRRLESGASRDRPIEPPPECLRIRAAYVARSSLN